MSSIIESNAPLTREDLEDALSRLSKELINGLRVEMQDEIESLRKEMRRNMEDMDRRIRITTTAPISLASNSVRPSSPVVGSVSKPIWGKRSHYG